MSRLGEFLKAKRASVAPHQVGLPAVGRPRRVRGLRREEVAQLADVSVDHYTRLEQGRTTSASEGVLNSIARALLLDQDERAYLLRLGRPQARGSLPVERVSQPTQVLLEGMGTAPALVLGRCMDILAWNRMATALFLDFPGLPTPHRNLVRLIFLEPRVRLLYPEWQQVAAEAVARLRMEAVKYPKDPRLARLIGELSTQDDDFRRWWGGHQIKAVSAGRKRIQHPVAGLLILDWQALTITAEQEQTLVVYTAPPGSQSSQALHFLSCWKNEQARHSL